MSSRSHSVLDSSQGSQSLLAASLSADAKATLLFRSTANIKDPNNSMSLTLAIA